MEAVWSGGSGLGQERGSGTKAGSSMKCSSATGFTLFSKHSSHNYLGPRSTDQHVLLRRK